ncbi:MAG TPA: DUF86 domain-containing protein [Candidatus Nanoarchaeia archaeon]|nr:DUF86 domain-containing protein [Candidatus Nanoarchaeia archaeon]
MNGKERILLKLDEMKKYLTELEDLLPEEQEYLSSLPDRRACEKTIELAIECVINVMAMLISQGKLGVPKDEEDIIAILGKRKILTDKLVLKVRGMKGLRNILVHKYGEIDDRRAYASLKEELGDFNLFEKEVKQYLKRK